MLREAESPYRIERKLRGGRSECALEGRHSFVLQRFRFQFVQHHLPPLWWQYQQIFFSLDRPKNHREQHTRLLWPPDGRNHDAPICVQPVRKIPVEIGHDGAEVRHLCISFCSPWRVPRLPMYSQNLPLSTVSSRSRQPLSSHFVHKLFTIPSPPFSPALHASRFNAPRYSPPRAHQRFRLRPSSRTHRATPSFISRSVPPPRARTRNG